MQFALRILALLVLAFVVSSCGEEEIRVLEEDKEAPLLFRSIEMEKARRGPEIGLRVRAKVDGYAGGSPNAYVRGRLLDGEGKALSSVALFPSRALVAQEDSAGGGISFQDTTSFVTSEVAGFSRIERDGGGQMELFFPYHWWKGETGLREMQLELTAMEGQLELDWEEDLPRALAQSQENRQVGRCRIAFPLDFPDLHTAQIWVQYLVLDTTAFDPHDCDLYFLATKPTYGFPDIFWNVGMDYQEVYRSPYYKNSISATWDSPSAPFFMDGRDAEVQLCVYDWDDSTWFNNRNDALSCWDGTLSSLSQDARNPTRLSFGLVAEMGVLLLLDGIDPWASPQGQ